MFERRPQSVWAALLCVGLCAGFAALAWAAVRGKSATWDEPSHALTGWLMFYDHDYRLSPDVPPLWEDWIALGMGKDAIHFDSGDNAYRHLQTKIDLFHWCVNTLYRTAGNDGIELVRRARIMALILGVLLAGLIGRWAWRLGGAAAGVMATFLYCADPNFLGHAPLAKNDVAFALIFFAAAMALWNFGRKVTWKNTVAVILLIAAAISVKISGVLLVPVVAVVLVYRAWINEPWMVLGHLITSRGKKLLVMPAVLAISAVVTYVGLWAMYGFRYDAGPGGMRSDTAYYLRAFARSQFTPQTGAVGWRPPLSTRVMLYAEAHHLLPQAFTSGFILTQYGNSGRVAYLIGSTYLGGRWYYFPLAAAFKTPLATLAAGVLALVAVRGALRRGLLKNSEHRWAAVCLAVPAGAYAAAIMLANLNIGLRHAFPIYPFVFVAISLAGAAAWRKKPAQAGQATAAQAIILALAMALVAETAAAFPNFIAFFNSACARDRLALLADSNLDWGQDLPLLAAWQRAHPDQTLYLDYFGMCDPAAYGIRYINVPAGYAFGPPTQWPSKPGVVAISATNLQQIYTPDARGEISTIFQGQAPQEVLGQTIFLFKFDPADFAPATKP